MGLSLRRRLGRNIADIFSADTAEDQARRRKAGQPRFYGEQQRQMGITHPASNPFEQARNIGVGAIRYTPQQVASVGVGLRQKFRNQPDFTFRPSNPVERFIFGREEQQSPGQRTEGLAAEFANRRIAPGKEKLLAGALVGLGIGLGVSPTPKPTGAIKGIVKGKSPTLPRVTAKTTETEVGQRVFENLPKGIKKKVELGQPLGIEHLKVVNRKTAQLGEAANQISLPLGKGLPTVRLRVATGAATRTTPKGQVKSILRGEQIVPKSLARGIRVVAQQPVGRFSKALATQTGRSVNEYRQLVNVINSVRKTKPKFADEFEDFTLRNIIEKDAFANQVVRGLRSGVRDTQKQAGAISKRDRTLLRDALDGKLGKNPASVISRTADNPNGVNAMSKSLRGLYDDALTAINEERRLAGLDLIPKRQDYFPHMKELLKLDFFTSPLKAHDPDYIRRLGSAFGFAKQRKGLMKDIEKDPLKVADVYLLAAERQIASAVPSARMNGIAKVLDDIGAKTNDEVLGWKHWINRINQDITGSSSVHNIMLRLQGRYAAGTIILNPGSTLKNLIQPALTTGVTRQHAIGSLLSTTMNSLRLLKDKNISRFLEIDGMRSPYLNSAFSAMDLTRISPKRLPTKIGDAFSKTFYATQLSGQRFIVDAFYRKNLAGGLSKRQALKEAERQAETMLPARTPGTLAPVTRGGTLSRAASLFQTEVIAQAEAMIQATTRGVFSKTKGATAANIAGLAAMGHLFNEAYEQLFPGQRPAPDPIQWVTSAVEKGAEENNIAAGALEFAKETVGQLPFIGSYFTYSGRSPLSIPILDVGRSVSKDVSKIVSGEASSSNVVRLGRNLSAFAGRGGKTIYRAGEGLARYAQGGVPEFGGTGQAYDIPQSTANLVRVLAGGASNTREAQEAFKDKKPQVSSKAGELTVPEKRQAAKDELATLREDPESVGLRPLPDGRYAYNIGEDVRTTRDLNEARDEIAKESLRQSGKNIKIVGDKVYRLQKDGDVSVTTKLSYDSSLLYNKLQSAKKRDDLEGWFKTADQQYNNLTEQLKDPTLDELEKSNIQEKIDNLLADAAKFKEYGGFTKGKKGRRVSISSAYKYAIPLGTGGEPIRPRISVRKRTAARAISRVAAKPRVSIKRSLV